MTALLPMAIYGLEVPPGDVAIPARPDIPASFRVTMAAIDPSAEPEGEDGAAPRATLKIIRQSLYEESDEDDEDDDEFDVERMEAMLAEDDDDDEDSEDDEEANGGPSDPAKSKKARKEAARKQIQQMLEDAEMEDDSDDAPNGINGTKSAKALGKMPASDDDDEEEDSDDEPEEFEEFVICTLDPNKNYQQPLDITVGENETVLFKVSGTHSIFLTGNYVEPAGEPNNGMYDPDSDEEGDYDLEPDSDEMYDEDDEEDELDDLDNPRVMEVDEDEDEEEAPKLVEAVKSKKGKNKRPAEDDDAANGASIDEMIAKEVKKDLANGEQTLSKKQLKKLKKNDGSATVTATEETKDGSGKKVQFAKELEQGPTPTKADKKDDKTKGALGVKKIQGVTIDDKKLGSGPAAKSGDRVGMRYIGKLSKNGKVFDSNKKGKPFSFKLGVGEVIKGWDIGVVGMTAGGERRITIPANLAYGSKGAGKDIPPNSELVFDVKLLEINKGK
ncbi:hypothetical protein PRZ48_010894 [Zasmidium cellare]|uniref:peptidylprolyl isomerase n=1 Tax=Zasmidium cellare TaxID=395010 RepID=A0ABR0E9Z9_ZASCE|nr:hypothetical protein PRZ48_010894 [Zasmidium cellare]